MKNLTKNMSLNILLIFTTLFATLFSPAIFAGGAGAIDHTFNYQGQLIDNGSPANGNYDITVSAYFSLTGGPVQGQVSEHLNIAVSNGLFTLNNVDVVDPGANSPFDGFDVYLEVAVKPAGSGSYTALSPRQPVQAVPFANNLTSKGAAHGEVLTYDGTTGQWEPGASSSSPWTVNGSDIAFNNGNVGIGTTSPSTGKLHIAYGAGENGIRVTDNTFVTRFWMHNNGGTAIGLGNTPPALGLRVEGDTKQSGESDGMMKYMVKATCTNDTQVVNSSYNGTTGSGSVTVSAFDINAGACRLTFPSSGGNMIDLNNRYWTATAVASSNVIVTCERNSSHTLDCKRTVSSSGSASGGQFMVLVY